MLVVDGKPYGLRLEHCWVEAQLNYDIDLGKRNPVSKDTTWIPMDPSYKILEYNDPVKLEEEVPLNADSLMEEIRASAIIDTITGAVTGMDTAIINQTLENYSSNLKNWTDENLGDSVNLGKVLSVKWIKPKQSEGFASVLPYEVTKRITEYIEIPNNYRYQITLEVMDEFGISSDILYTISTIELAEKRVFLAYAPATSSDEEAILSQAPDTTADSLVIPSKIVAYLIKMKPQIIIDNQVVRTGSTIQMGKEQKYKISIDFPSGSKDVIQNCADVGSLHSINLDLSIMSRKKVKKGVMKLKEITEKIDANDYSSVTSYDLIGELLALVSDLFFHNIDTYSEWIAMKLGVYRQKTLSEAVTSLALNTEMLLGMPYRISAEGLCIDVDRNVEAVFGIDGDVSVKKSYGLSTGIMMSEMEARVFELIFKGIDENSPKALSAIRIIQIANEQQIPVYKVDNSNLTQILNLLQVDSETKQAVSNSVNSGKVVYIPQRNIDFYGWEGTGYIILDPETGAGAYQIKGINGGEFWVGLCMLYPKLCDLINILLHVAVWAGIIAAIVLIVKFIWIAFKDPAALMMASFLAAIKDNMMTSPFHIMAQVFEEWTRILAGYGPLILYDLNHYLLTLLGVSNPAGAPISEDEQIIWTLHQFWIHLQRLFENPETGFSY